ncbi:hypothetical protein ASZ90_008880 [hydrocarbon metagenome]|uniref:Uncharacterized protein n=1 Tax=hydrocarbon metagenome TaxID=938273 RepID=A0A0W8FKC8_9ZZZZ
MLDYIQQSEYNVLYNKVLEQAFCKLSYINPNNTYAKN